jgi:hypothetical protein
MKKTTQLSRAVIKTVAGAAITNPNDFIKLAAHAADESLKGNFSKALLDTYAFFINRGDIDAKYLDSGRLADLAPEFKKISDQPYSIDQLNYLRKIFVNLAKDNTEQSHKKYLLDIALLMEEPEMKVLIADYRIASESIWKPSSGVPIAAEWRREVAVISGLQHEALVGLYSEKLEAKMLISERQYSDKSGIAWNNKKSRLTTMGYELCRMTMLDDDPLEQ